MCLAIPMKVIEKVGPLGKVSQGGVTYDVNFTLLPDIKLHEYVLVHAGFAIQRISATDAEETLRLFEEMFRGQSVTKQANSSLLSNQPFTAKGNENHTKTRNRKMRDFASDYGEGGGDG